MYIAHPPPVPPVVSPRIVVVESTAPVRRHRSPCLIATWSPAPTAATLVVAEWPGRPLAPKPRTLLILHRPIIECFGGWGGFADLGRYVVYAMVGRRAPPRAVAQLRRAYAALRLRR